MLSLLLFAHTSAALRSLVPARSRCCSQPSLFSLMFQISVGIRGRTCTPLSALPLSTRLSISTAQDTVAHRLWAGTVRSLLATALHSAPRVAPCAAPLTHAMHRITPRTGDTQTTWLGAPPRFTWHWAPTCVRVRNRRMLLSARALPSKPPRALSAEAHTAPRPEHTI